MYPIGSNVIHRDLSDTAVIERKVNHNNNSNTTVTTPTTIPINNVR